jgi:phage I-like protein
MNTSKLIAIQCHAKPQPGEKLIAVARPCSAVIAADAKPDAPLPTELVWMPRGDHEINAYTMAGSYWSGLVRCDELGASVVSASFERARAAGYRVWLDCNHDDGAATADVRGFSWDPARGIVAKVEWTPLGERSLRERIFCSFSPTFWVDWESGRVSGLVEGHAAGGLVNAPAFGAAMPALIAARLGGAETINPAPGGSPGNHNTDTTMNREKMLKVLAALAVTVPADATDAQVNALYAQHAGPQPANDAAREIATLREQLTALQSSAAKPEEAAAIKAMKAQLDALVAAAKSSQKKRGESAIQAAVDRGAIKSDDAATRADLMAIYEHDEDRASRILAAMPGKPTAASVIVAPDVAQRGAAVTAQVTREDLVTALKAYHAEKDPQNRRAIYAASLAKPLSDKTVILGPILAANSLGTSSGSLVTQRSLSLLKFVFPELSVITTDFSSEGAKKDQQVISRIRAIPTASNFVAGTGYTTSDATTSDVPVTISAHKGVELSFNANELSSTDRDLFGEQVEGAHYALGKELVDAIYAIITVANFPTETISELNDFGRPKMQALRKALNGRKVPKKIARFALLDPDYADKLGNDASLVSLATFQRPEIITEGMLPRVSGFQPYETETLPDAQNLVGFAGTAEAIVLATRTPADYAMDGSIEIVSNPDTGITVHLVRFIDHKKAASYWRIALQYGAAKGNPDCGERLVSAANA